MVNCECGGKCGRCGNKLRALLGNNDPGGDAGAGGVLPPDTVPPPPEAAESTPVMNPFVSRSQQRACYAADDPRWDCHEWGQKSKGKKLPEHKKGAKPKATENCLAKLIANANPEGHNQYSGGSGKQEALKPKESKDADWHSTYADKTGERGDHLDAAKAHGKLYSKYGDLSYRLSAAGDEEGATRMNRLAVHHMGQEDHHLLEADKIQQGRGLLGRIKGKLLGNEGNRLMDLFGMVTNSNPEGINQYSGAAGIHRAYETASTLSEGQHGEAHAAVDAASHAELKEVLAKMRMHAGSRKDAVKVVKDAISARRRSAMRAKILERPTGNINPKHPQHGRFLSPRGPSEVGGHAEKGWANAHAFEGKETPEEEAMEGHECAADKVARVAENCSGGAGTMPTGNSNPEGHNQYGGGGVKLSGGLGQAYKNSERKAHLKRRISLLSGPTLEQRPADHALVKKMKAELDELEGKGMPAQPTGNAWTDEARQAATAARQASGAAAASSGGQFPQGKAAAAAAGKGDHARAEQLHREAAQAHFDHAQNPVGGMRPGFKEGQMGAFRAHLAAADANGRAAKLTANAWSPQARVAAAAARAASHTAHEYTKEAVGAATNNPKWGPLHGGEPHDSMSHEDAAQLHDKMARMHKEQIKSTSEDLEDQDDINHSNAQIHHEEAADAHRKAVKLGAVTNEGGGFESDEQRNAFFGLLRSGKGGEAGKAAGAKSDVAHAATDALSETAEKRSGIAKKVNKDRQAGEHAKAEAAHREAGKAHWAAAKGTNDKFLKGQHELAAKHHFNTAKEHAAKASTTTNEATMKFNRDQVLDALTANCTSAEDAVALNALPDSALQAIVNAKAPGSGADLTDGGGDPVRVGGIEEKVKDENDEDWSKDTERAAKKKAPSQGISTPAMNEDDEDEEDEEEGGMAMNRKGKGRLMTFNEVLNSVDLEMRESLLIGRDAARREKRGLVLELIANVDDDATRNRLGNKLFRLPKAELEERLLLVPQTRNRREQRPAPSYAGRGGGMVENFGASSSAADTSDVLPIITMNDVPDPRNKSRTQTA